ncbi:hypothetical protein EDD16DRAFT_1710054 [Pisolithus croceorrhizus]|nr:hypothetical protein EDD16DRAFT_1710054 [Pisolithus croceorrhizus]KAI6125481.1 hypothetical protein EV401DRAFT_2068234 [Pisolithus croceorrhizus]KAI6160952.1 hypothetical protein EDD17DRAFT_1759898 [Pisolithus thermaeus]
MLTTVIYGACQDEPSSDVQLAAVHALCNSLELNCEDFEREGERNYIMQVCFVKTMALYYDKMTFYAEQALFGLTTTVYEEEIEFATEARETRFGAADHGEPPEVESKFFAKIMLPEEEDADEDQWNTLVPASTYLNFMARPLLIQ